MPSLRLPRSATSSRLAHPLRRAARPTAHPQGARLPGAHLLGARLLGACLLEACLLGAGLAGGAQAGPLADPTRPPSVAGNADAGPARARDGRLTAPPARPAAVAMPLPVLQSVRVPATGPATAMIDGQSVRAGDTVGGRLVQAIDRQGITLAGRPNPERVLLLGGSTKQPPGSIVTTHATRYEPATADAADTPQRADRPGLATPTATTSPTTSPTMPAPLSVAGRTAP